MEQSPIASGNNMAAIKYNLVSEGHTVTFVSKPLIDCVVIGKPVEFPLDQIFFNNKTEIDKNAKFDEG